MKQLKILGYCLLLFTCTHCNKKLEIAPENTLTDKAVFATEAGSDQALAEAYYNLYIACTRSLAYVLGDVTTDILQTTPFYNTYKNGATTPADESVSAIWTNYYTAINTANNVIAKIPLFGAFEENKKKQFIAEAKFIRSFSYLELLKMFGDGALTHHMQGLGLPLQLKQFEGYNTGAVIPRSTNEAVYKHIVAELQAIEEDLLLQHNTDLKTRARATKGNALALLARCYLYMQDYTAAAATAEKLVTMTNKPYELTANLHLLFPENKAGDASKTITSEYILCFPVSYMTSSSTKENNGLGNGYYYKRSYWINQSFLSEFDPIDARFTQLIYKGDQMYNEANLNDYTSFKFNNPEGRDNVSVIRYAEVLLTGAEALARTTGITFRAVELLNLVRSRAMPAITPYTTNDFDSKEALIAAILRERKKELAFEGHLRYDLIRTGQPLIQPDIPDDKKVLPVPQVEIDIAPGVIKQNPGYLK